MNGNFERKKTNCNGVSHCQVNFSCSKKENENKKNENIQRTLDKKNNCLNFTIEKKYKKSTTCNNINEDINCNSNDKEKININNDSTYIASNLDFIDEIRKIKELENSQQIKTSEEKEQDLKIKSFNKSKIENKINTIEKNICSENKNQPEVVLNSKQQKIKLSNFKKLGLIRNLNNTNRVINNTKINFEDVKNINNIYAQYSIKNFSERKDHYNNNSNYHSNNKHICCDEIFYEYLKSITKYANQKYFSFVLKFIIIFRECINTYKNIELENSILVLKEKISTEIKEFTQYYDAEQAPELCNEFISEYLQSCDYFGFEKNEIPEIIDIIQHFCYWMYENNYTSSRLSLLNMN